MPVNDVVDEIGDGILLINLLEVLSEQNFPGKYDQKPKMRVQKIDNLNRGLNFCFKECGVQMKVKPSAEDLADADEKRILGLVWSIMLKYMKFGDDDDQLNAKDALLLWVQNKTSSYGLKIENFGKDFKNGMALCAILHKHRPNLLDYESLNPAKAMDNLALAQDAAEKYFALEKYITPEDITKLDENSMVVYVSEYYYGIAEQRKVDLAVRRVHKLIDFTETNDALRKEFNETADTFKGQLKKVEGVLEDRTIDNTMAGAKKRIEDFYEYKRKDKGEILANQLNLQGVYNNLSMRLAHRNRPPFQPAEGCSLKDVDAAMRHLEECEAERKVALHKELNRQIRLVQLNQQHQEGFDQISAWNSEKEAYLNTKEVSTNVGAAQYQLGRLDDFDKEKGDIQKGKVANLTKTANELYENKYENSDSVKSREENVSNWFANLTSKSAAKRLVLDDDLAREKFRQHLSLQDQEHQEKFDELNDWIKVKEEYLNKKEVIESVAEAQLQIALLEAFEDEKVGRADANVAPLKALGQEMLNAKYQTEYSSAECENPDEIKKREAHVDDKWAEFTRLSAHKKAVLEDDLAREKFKAKLRVWNITHENKYQELKAWVAEKENYLNTREEIDTITKALVQISILQAYEKDKVSTTNTNVASLKKIGKDILTAEYKTEYSHFVWEKPEEIQNRESNIDSDWANLSTLSATKKEWLDSELKREERKEELRLAYAEYAGEFTRFCAEMGQACNITHFGFTLEEVEAEDAKLKNCDNETNKWADEKTAQFTDAFNEGAQLGVKENVYATQSLDDLAALRSGLTAALAKRRSNYDAELQRQRENDALCKKFAGVADPFSQWIIKQKESISLSNESLDTQFAAVTGHLNNLDAEGKDLAEIRSLQQQIDDRGITNNRHTILTATDVDVQWQQWQIFLNSKKKMLEEAIEHAKLRGITPEEYKEIEENFTQFDKGGKGHFVTRELKACLYSLGFETGAVRIQEIMNTHGADGKIDYNGFKEFMIQLIGDTDTKDEILDGFKLINRGDVISVERLEFCGMEQHDIDYLKSTAPAVDGGYNFHAWTDDVFSR